MTVRLALFVFVLSAVACGVRRSSPVRIEISGVATQTFQQCTVRSATDVIELRDASGTTRMMPGRIRYPPVVCSRALTTDKSFWDWRKQGEQGTLTRKTMIAVFLDGSGSELARIRIVRAWPSAATIKKREPDGTHIEEIEIAHEGLQRE